MVEAERNTQLQLTEFSVDSVTREIAADCLAILYQLPRTAVSKYGWKCNRRMQGGGNEYRAQLLGPKPGIIQSV
jgi:hypothetical protein